MAFADIFRLPRNIQRLGEIILTFVRYGFGPFVAKLNIHENIPFIRGILSKRNVRVTERLSPEERMVRAFQELGTTFIKLGQILSSRPDIVGASFADEFRRLQDSVAPFDSAVAKNIVEAELGRPISELFTAFDDIPVGSGSIAQVHRAILLDGREVMVKIRRPNIEKAIEADIAILRFIAKLAEPQFPEIRPTQIVDEFDRTIANELDFTVEAANTARFHEMLLGAEGVCGPKVFWEYTTASVLVIQRMKGISVANIDALDAKKIDRRLVAKRLGDCFMMQYFRKGAFHADPHPGNILVADDGMISIIDYGMTGHLSSDLQSLLTTAMIASVRGEVDVIAETLAELGTTGENYNERQFRRDVNDMYHKYVGMPLGQVDPRRLYNEITHIARANDMSLPRDLVLLGKSLSQISVVTRALDPSYDVLRMAAPKTREFLKDKIDPKRLASRAGLSALSTLRILKNLPKEFRNIIRKAEAGQFQIVFQHRGLERAVNELDRASNRLAISIYVAALFVASSLIIKTNFASINGISVPGILGYILGGLLSLWLAWGVLRSGRL